MRYTISLSAATMLWASTALAEVPRVVTDIPPVHGLVAMVMGDLGQPELLLGRGGDAHSFQLRPSQAQALAEAGLIVWIGPEMTPWLGRTLAGLDASGVQVRLLTVPGTFTQAFGAGHDQNDHAAKAETEADQDHDGTDPHAWLDPGNASHWLGVIAGELAALDPEHAEIYAANATAGQAQIAALDAELAALLAPVKDKPFVVFHDAYGYFRGHYGLSVAGSVALGDAASPGAAHLAQLQAAARTEALCLFPEAGHDPKLLEQMAEATGVRLGGMLDPEGAALKPGAGLYANLMRGLATTLANCLTKG